jgi:Zn-dependent alcohol dehydrogenase
MRITAAVMERSDGKLSKRKIELQEVELDRPRAHEVLVRITSCGVCGTDRGCIHGLEPGWRTDRRPLLPAVVLMKLQLQGRFPLEELVNFYDFAEINQAIDDSDNGKTVKPVVRMRA